MREKFVVTERLVYSRRNYFRGTPLNETLQKCTLFSEAFIYEFIWLLQVLAAALGIFVVFFFFQFPHVNSETS